MKKQMLMVIVLAAGALWGQSDSGNQEKFQSNIIERTPAPTKSDMYCSGFITKEEFPMANFVVGSKVIPNAARFVSTDGVYLTGAGFEVGKAYRLIRRVRDRNRTQNSPTQNATRAASGSKWADIGIVKVSHIENGFAVAEIVFSCQDAQEGDIALPTAERPTPAYTHAPKDFARFGVPSSNVSGQIIDSPGDDYLLGTNSHVYVNLGAKHGLKVGDYLRVTRGNSDKELSPVEAASRLASIVDETTEKMPKVRKGAEDKFPKRGLGEIMILDVHPETATGIVTVAVEDIHIGDRAEVVNAPAPTDSN